MSADAIGGYLELELPRAGAGPHPDALAFQSARAAFRALLEGRLAPPRSGCRTTCAAACSSRSPRSA